MAGIEQDGEQKPYEYVPFPKVVYSAKGEAKTVGSEREMSELGDGWKESPADFEKKSGKVKVGE